MPDIWAAPGRRARWRSLICFCRLPWLFLLITVRALMPLNVSPLSSVLVTFLILGLLGWTSAARVLCATAGTLRGTDFVRQARASGVRGATTLLGARAAQSEAGVVCAVLDFDSRVHFGRGEPGDSRPGRRRADAFLGKSAEGIRGADLSGRRTLEVRSAWRYWWSS